MVTPKHNNRAKRFVLEYSKDFNGTRAAIAAGYSVQTARAQASRLLTKSNIREDLEKILPEQNERLKISAERVLRELARLAFLDPRKLFREDGSLKPMTELDDDTAAALTSMEIEKRYEHYAKGQARNTRTVTKIKFADTVRALELLGRHLKLFTDKVEVSRFEGLRTHPNEVSASDTEHAVVFGNHVRIHVCQCNLRGWRLKVNGFRRNATRLRYTPLRCIALKNR